MDLGPHQASAGVVYKVGPWQVDRLLQAVAAHVPGYPLSDWPSWTRSGENANMGMQGRGRVHSSRQATHDKATPQCDTQSNPVKLREAAWMMSYQGGQGEIRSNSVCLVMGY